MPAGKGIPCFSACDQRLESGRFIRPLCADDAADQRTGQIGCSGDEQHPKESPVLPDGKPDKQQGIQAVEQHGKSAV